MIDKNQYIPLSEMPHYAKKKPSVFQNPFNRANLEATKQRGKEALHAAKVVGKGAIHGIQAAHTIALDLKKSEAAKHLRKVGYGQEHQFGISYFNQPSKKIGNTNNPNKKKKFNRGVPDFGFGFV